jgi:LysR family transcriptional regulator for bpeEF and oprC
MKGLQQFAAFAGTARHGSFAAASRELGTSPSTLAKAVGRLEASLGVKLFHRTTREVRLTPDGERLFERCHRVLAEVEELEADAAGARSVPSGTLRIDAPIVYGKRVVIPLLADLMRTHPALQLDLRLQDAYADMVRDRVDIAVRVGALQDSTLIARRIDRQGLVLCASRAYVAQRGMPRRIADLAAHAAVVFRMPSSGRDRPWQFRQRGAPIVLTPTSRVRIDDGEGLVEAVRAGLGLCQLPDYMVADAIADGSLVEVLPSFRPEPMPISAVCLSGRLLPARVRVALDALASLRRGAAGDAGAVGPATRPGLPGGHPGGQAGDRARRV